MALPVPSRNKETNMPVLLYKYDIPAIVVVNLLPQLVHSLVIQQPHTVPILVTT